MREDRAMRRERGHRLTAGGAEIWWQLWEEKGQLLM